MLTDEIRKRELTGAIVEYEMQHGICRYENNGMIYMCAKLGIHPQQLLRKTSSEAGQNKGGHTYMKSISIDEQETTINFSRRDEYAEIYTCDSTVITKLDKLAAMNPDAYTVIKRDDYGVKYRVANKRLVSFRKPMSEAQREARRAGYEYSLKKAAKQRENQTPDTFSE